MSSFSLFLQQSRTPMHLIEPNLYLGNLQGANDQQLLARNGIECVVQCLQDRNLSQSFPYLTYHYIPIIDLPSQNIAAHVPEAIRFIHRQLSAGKTVLVHCQAGVSRSPSIVVAYYMAKYQVPFELAIDMVKSKRLCVYPNPGFEEQLRRLTLEELQSWIS